MSHEAMHKRRRVILDDDDNEISTTNTKSNNSTHLLAEKKEVVGVECRICQDQCIALKLLPCLHSFCPQCVEDLLRVGEEQEDKRRASCFLCHELFDQSELLNNYVLAVATTEAKDTQVVEKSGRLRKRDPLAEVLSQFLEEIHNKMTHVDSLKRSVTAESQRLNRKVEELRSTLPKLLAEINEKFDHALLQTPSNHETLEEVKEQLQIQREKLLQQAKELSDNLVKGLQLQLENFELLIDLVDTAKTQAQQLIALHSTYASPSSLVLSSVPWQMDHLSPSRIEQLQMFRRVHAQLKALNEGSIFNQPILHDAVYFVHACADWDPRSSVLDVGYLCTGRSFVGDQYCEITKLGTNGACAVGCFSSDAGAVNSKFVVADQKMDCLNIFDTSSRFIRSIALESTPTSIAIGRNCIWVLFGLDGWLFSYSFNGKIKREYLFQNSHSLAILGPSEELVLLSDQTIKVYSNVTNDYRWFANMTGLKAVATTSKNEIFVCEAHSKHENFEDRIQILSQDGDVIRVICQGQVHGPRAIAIVRDHLLVVAESVIKSVSVWTMSGELVNRWDGFNNPRHIAVHPNDRVAVVDKLKGIKSL